MPLSIAPPATDIEIISQASALCGKQTFNTIEAGGSFAKDAQAFYGTLVSAELGSNRWRFAMHNQSLANLNTLDPAFEGWLYYWDFPADLIMLHRLDPMIDYTVFGERLVTRSNQAVTAIYSRNVPVSKWPPTFSMYIIYALADTLAISVTNSDRMVARIREGLKNWHSRALFSDGQSSRPRSMRSRPYLDARYGFRISRS